MSTPPRQRWIDSWDRQQEGYVRNREARFAAMFEVLEARTDGAFTAVDLGAGPGSLSRRLLERFPHARVVAVDLDPVLVALGRHTAGDAGGRLQWVEADLRDPGWPAAAGLDQVDAVLSSTALHYLTAEEVTDLYRLVAGLVRPGGVLLDADHLAYGEDTPVLAAVSRHVQDRRTAQAFGEQGALDWTGWWEQLREQSAGVLDHEERARRFAYRAGQQDAVRLDLAGRRRALQEAGFREVGTVWQDHADRVLAAVR